LWKSQPGFSFNKTGSTLARVVGRGREKRKKKGRGKLKRVYKASWLKGGMVPKIHGPVVSRF